MSVDRTEKPRTGLFWVLCQKCLGYGVLYGSRCDLCQGTGSVNLLWWMQPRTHKHGVINMDPIP